MARDLAEVPLGWEVEGVMSPEESVLGMLRVISSKTVHDSGTFWTWEGKVSTLAPEIPSVYVRRIISLVGTSMVKGLWILIRVLIRRGRQPEGMGRTCLRVRRRRGGSLSLWHRTHRIDLYSKCSLQHITWFFPSLSNWNWEWT